jgi:hypothetical protein
VDRISLAVGPATGDAPNQPVTAFTGLRIKLPLYGAPTVDFTIPGRSPAALVTSGLATDVWSYRNGVLKTRTRVLPVKQKWTADGDDQATITSIGYRGVVERRHIIDGPPQFANTDQGAILWALVQHTQAQQGGDLGIIVADHLTGQLRDRLEYQIGDNIGKLMSDLGDVENGVWWGIDANKVFTAKLWTAFPTRLDPIVLGMNCRNMDRSPGASFANVGGAVGSSTDTYPVWASTDDVGVDERGRWEVFDASHSSVIEQATVLEYAEGIRDQSAHPPSLWTLDMEPLAYFEGGSDYNEGEYVRIVVPISSIDELGVPPIDVTAQITEVSIGADDAGAVTVTIAAVEVERADVGPPPLDPPINTAAPVITGTLVTQDWTATTGTWINADSFTFLWQQAPTANGPWTVAATSDAGGSIITQTYDPPDADAGTYYRIQVTATGPGGQVVAYSGAQQSDGLDAPVNTVAPVLGGAAPTPGQPWTVSNGTWTDASTYAYQWQSAASATGPWTNISGATGSTYTPPAT